MMLFDRVTTSIKALALRDVAIRVHSHLAQGPIAVTGNARVHHALRGRTTRRRARPIKLLTQSNRNLGRRPALLCETNEECRQVQSFRLPPVPTQVSR